MTIATCLERAKVFRAQGRIAEAEGWEARAVKHGYKPEPPKQEPPKPDLPKKPKE